MTKLFKQLILAAGIAAASTTVAIADSGDNSMSRWTGESYAAFYGGNVGDFYTEHDHVAKSYPAAEPGGREMVASAGKHEGRIEHGERTNPFRDDTAG
jgi:hypothetical protein